MRSKEKQNFTNKMMDYDNNKTGLLDRTLSAEKKWRTSEKKSHCASRRLKDVREVGDDLEMQVATLSNENEQCRAEIQKLTLLLGETSKQLTTFEHAVPIKCIQKETLLGQKCGQLPWPLYVWDLIMEQLVNGTPPSAVWSNIVLHVKTFSPSTTIKDTISYSILKRAQTVLLVVTQTLAAYRLAKADKWLQVFTDQLLDDMSLSKIWSLV